MHSSAPTIIRTAPGALPVAGWGYALAKLDLWRSGFALMAALWLVCSGSVVVLRSPRP